jgi:hypothetical protein
MGAQTNGGLTPYPSQTPTGPRASTAAAWGMGNGNGGARTAMIGGCTVALASAVLLLFLWYSLPR